MCIVNIHYAKTHLSKLLAQAAAGEEVVIAKAGKPLVKMVPIEPEKKDRVLGLDAGTFEIPEDFDNNEELIKDFEDSKIFPKP